MTAHSNPKFVCCRRCRKEHRYYCRKQKRTLPLSSTLQRRDGEKLNLTRKPPEYSKFWISRISSMKQIWSPLSIKNWKSVCAYCLWYRLNNRQRYSSFGFGLFSLQSQHLKIECNRWKTGMWVCEWIFVRTNISPGTPGLIFLFSSKMDSILTGGMCWNYRQHHQ